MIKIIRATTAILFFIYLLFDNPLKLDNNRVCLNYKFTDGMCVGKFEEKLKKVVEFSED